MLFTEYVFLSCRFAQLCGMQMIANWFLVAQMVLCMSGICPQERERQNACSSLAATTVLLSPPMPKLSLLLDQTTPSRRLQIPRWVCPCPASGLLHRSAGTASRAYGRKYARNEGLCVHNIRLLIPFGLAQLPSLPEFPAQFPSWLGEIVNCGLFFISVLLAVCNFSPTFQAWRSCHL